MSGAILVSLIDVNGKRKQFLTCFVQSQLTRQVFGRKYRTSWGRVANTLGYLRVTAKQKFYSGEKHVSRLDA